MLARQSRAAAGPGRGPPDQRRPGIHADDTVFGYRFIVGELRARASPPGRTRWRGCAAAADLVRLQKEARLSRKAGPPDRIWLTDITEHPTGHSDRGSQTGPRRSSARFASTA